MHVTSFHSTPLYVSELHLDIILRFNPGFFRTGNLKTRFVQGSQTNETFAYFFIVKS